MSALLATYGPWLGAGVLILALLVMFRHLIGRLLRLLLRTAAGLGVLALTRPLSALIGVTLGLNFTNALVLGVLGAPGFGLLLLLHWTLAQ